MSKYILVFPAILLLALSSCKKPDTANPSGNNAPLVPESSGWHKTGTVKFTYTNMGYAGQNSFMPIELMQTGGETEILYSENFQLFGTNGHVIYKGHYAAGTDDTAAITKLPNLNLGGDASTYSGKSYPHFIPGTYTVEALKYFKNGPDDYFGVMDETNAFITSIRIIHPEGQGKIFSNGDVADGLINYSGYASIEYYSSASHNWLYIAGTSHDTTNLWDYRPFSIPLGTPLAFNVTYKDSLAYLSIADPDGAALYPTPLYHSRFLQHIPELDGDFYTYAPPSIITTCQEGNKFTAVLGSYGPGSSKIKKVSSYSWTLGSTSFTTNYSNVDINSYSSDFFTANSKCTIDGTLYSWFADQTGSSYSLHTVDASGAHQLGTITSDGIIMIGAVNYMNGAFYGVAYPVTDAYDTDHNLHMDIIKLTP